MKLAEEVSKDYRQIAPEQLNYRADRQLDEVQAELENVQNALKIDESLYGPKSWRIAPGANNLGIVRQGLGDFNGAKSVLSGPLMSLKQLTVPTTRILPHT